MDMCTAVTYRTNGFYLGRTLDYEHDFGQLVVVTPRKYPFCFDGVNTFDSHYAIIGMARVEDGYPLYFDAMNEKGLAMAGLNFVGNAVYQDAKSGKINIPQYAFISWLLSQCGCLEEAKNMLKGANLTGETFKNLPQAQLHWIIADKTGAVTVESMKDGLFVYDNPVGILTNNPSFPEQLFQLNNYLNLTPDEPKNRFCDKINLTKYSRGMGALGLPGDLSSQSRFVRAAFGKLNSVSGNSEAESVSQCFHILDTVKQIRGCCRLGENAYEITRYAACCSAENGIYYYKTYENHQIHAVHLSRCELDGTSLFCYPLEDELQVKDAN
jgi:choloylglycine hydrolase